LLQSIWEPTWWNCTNASHWLIKIENEARKYVLKLGKKERIPKVELEVPLISTEASPLIKV